MAESTGAEGALPVLATALADVEAKFDQEQNYLERHMVSAEERSILGESKRPSQMTIREALLAYEQLQKVAIDRVHRDRYVRQVQQLLEDSL